MNRLVVILSVAIYVLITSNAAWAVSKSKFKKQIVGKTVTMHHKKKDFEIIRYFGEDGSLVENHGRKGYRKGNWEIDGRKLCIAFRGETAKCRKMMKKSGKFGTANRKGNKMVIVFESYENGNQIKGSADSPAADTANNQYKEQVITLQSRKKVTQSFLLIEPNANPKGIILQFPGHEGVVRFKKVANQYFVDNESGGLPAHEKSWTTLSKAGYAVAILAPPSDHKYGMDTPFRFSDKHSKDAKTVIDYLRKKYNQDVYVWGHCRSTLSPPAVVAHIRNDGVAGMILSSTRTQGNHGSVMDLPQSTIKVPVLLVHHKDDPCDGTPYKNVPKLKAYYDSSAPEVKVITVSGGDARREKYERGCAGGHHAFKGVRKHVVNAIVKWLDKGDVPQYVP